MCIRDRVDGAATSLLPVCSRLQYLAPGSDPRRAGAHERSWTWRRLWQASFAMRQRPPDTALSRRCLLRLIGGAATLQIPTFALAGFDFFLSEYTTARAELQAEICLLYTSDAADE